MTGSRLCTHVVTLRCGTVTLRPMTEGDLPMVAAWWKNPGIGYYADAENTDYALEQVRDIARSISGRAYCFIIEYEGKPVGDCWLQDMNLDRILERNRGLDCRRIDLEIEEDYWGRGIGTEAINLLAAFGFGSECADLIFAVDVADYNPRSRRAFEKAGFELYATVIQPSGARADVAYDLVLRRPQCGIPNYTNSL